MSVAAVIPARGGSKRLPGKNMALLQGKPLLQWTIEAARAAHSLDAIYVSTDSNEIAAFAVEAGVDVIRRPCDICQDHSTAEEALLHAVCVMPVQPSILVMLQCTAPFTSPLDIDACVYRLREPDCDSCFTGAPYTGFIWAKGHPQPYPVNHPRYVRLRTQDITDQYIETGSVYAMRVVVFEREQYRFCGKVQIVTQPEERNFDINTKQDIRVAEAILQSKAQI